MTSAFVYNPTSDSLESRIDALKDALDLTDQALLSYELKDDPDWSDTLGEEDEIQTAVDIHQNSVNHALAAVSENDLDQAKDLNLLNNKELVYLIRIKRKHELSTNKSQRTDYQSSRKK